MLVCMSLVQFKIQSFIIMKHIKYDVKSLSKNTGIIVESSCMCAYHLVGIDIVNRPWTHVI